MNISEKLNMIQEVVSEFGFTAVVASNDLVIVRNKKNEICAKVTNIGVEQLYAGAKNLCGSLVRNKIKAVIS